MTKSHTRAYTEYCALAHATSELLWIESLLKELNIPYQVPTLLRDTISVVMISHNSVLHARTKHVELNIHFVREQVTTNKLLIQHIPSTLQIADAITKPLSHTIFQAFKDKLKVSPYSNYDLEGDIRYIRISKYNLI